MISYHFDGCALGMKDQWDNPLKKPWAVATDHAGIGIALSKFQCKCDQPHAQGRGIALKLEEYTFKMADAIHKALTQQQPSLKLSCCALFSRFPRTLPTMLARAIVMARECAVAGRPAVLERITQWERSLNVFRAAVATAIPGTSPGISVSRLFICWPSAKRPKLGNAHFLGSLWCSQSAGRMMPSRRMEAAALTEVPWTRAQV